VRLKNEMKAVSEAIGETVMKRLTKENKATDELRDCSEKFFDITSIAPIDTSRKVFVRKTQLSNLSRTTHFSLRLKKVLFKKS
jgi:hypothetical protein